MKIKIPTGYLVAEICSDEERPTVTIYYSPDGKNDKEFISITEYDSFSKQIITCCYNNVDDEPETVTNYYKEEI